MVTKKPPHDPAAGGWSGRFGEPVAERVKRFTASVEFDQRLAATRNPYDPQYRGACDLYNGALESALRIVCASKELMPGNIELVKENYISFLQMRSQ